MNRKIVLPPFTQDELRRLKEIEFYYYTLHLFQVLGDKQTTYQIIENLCQAANCSITIIKTLTANFRALNNRLMPFKDEFAVMMYRNGMTVEQICKFEKLSPKTVYEYIKTYYNVSNREYLPKLKLEFFESVSRYTDLLKELTTYDEFNI